MIQKRLLLLCVCMMVFGALSHAATKTSAVSGNWGTAGTWSPSGVPGLNDIVIIAAGTTVTVTANTANIGDITIQSGATLQGDGTGKVLSMGRGGGEDFTNNGTLNASGANAMTIKLNKSSQWGGTSPYNCSFIDLSGKTLSFTAGVNVTVNLNGSPDPFLNPGTVNPSTTVMFVYNGSSAQNLSSSGNVSINNLTISNSSGVNFQKNLTTANLTGNLTINGGANLLTSNGTTAFTITGAAGKTLSVAAGGQLTLGSSAAAASTFPTGFSTVTLNEASTVLYSNSSSATQAISLTPAYGNLSLSGTGAKSLASGTLTMSGDWTNNSSGLLTVSNTNTALFGSGSTSSHTISGLNTTTFSNVTINNSLGMTVGAPITVNRVLTLTSGVVSTGANVLSVGATGSVARTSGYVNGNLQKNVATGATSRTFEIGDASTYTPVTVAFGNVSVAGNLSAKTTPGDHPSLSSSAIDGSKSVNRFWTLTNIGVTFNNYDATFNFVPGDVDAGASTANFVVNKFNSPNWTSPTVGTRTATSTQATGLTSFSDFAIGEAGTYTITASAGANGSIAPSGAVLVNQNANQTFTITPNANYHIVDVVVDGVSQGSVGSYPFTSVAANHTISASFAINTYTLTVNATNGSVAKSPDQANYDHGTLVALTPTPSAGYHFVSWSGDASGSANPLSVTMDGNKNITANFAINTYTLTVNAVNGTVAKAPDQATYDHGTSVDLTPTPSAGYHFVSWSGDASGSANPLSVTMDGNKNITANFAINTYTLDVVATNGSVSKNPDQATYDHGTLVDLTPTPAANYHFVSWSGDASGSANPLSVTMDGNKNITANFAINTYTLTVNAVNGTVAKVPDQVSYDHGTSVELTATPSVGYHFVDWSGDTSSSSNPLTVTMEGNKNITANFAINTYTLTVNAVNGTVAKAPDQVTYDHGTSVDLTPTPSAGYHFVSWSGDASGSANPLSVTMDGNKNITANFAINTYTLTVNAVNGTVAKAPDQATYDHGTSVELTATPSAGYHFVDWSGDTSSSSNPLTVTMDGNKNITANFAINTYSLSVSATNGSVSKAPDQPSYDHGSTVVLTATPAVGYNFVNWTGDASGSVNPLSVTMDGNKNITANFAINTYTLTVNAVNGSVGKAPDQASYNHGSLVELTATPSTGYHFVGWSGDASGSTNPLSVTMDSSKNITATFAINTYTLDITATNGSVAKNPDQANYDHGSSVELTATPSSGYHFVGWSGDASGSVNPLSVTMDGNKNITAGFAIDTITITASAGANGNISPSGGVQVTFGANQAFTITPNTGYHVDSVMVDGVRQDSTAGYTFTNVTGNHTINVTFAANIFAITSTAGTGGSISPSGVVNVAYGNNQAFAITPDAGYHLLDLFVDGLHQDSTSSYTFINVSASHSIQATFAIDAFTINATATAGGSINPSGNVNANYGATQAFTFAADSGFHFDSLFVDGLHQDSTSSYTFTNITANHTIHVTFAVNMYTITATADSGGTITPSGSVSVAYGGSKQFTFSPNAGFFLASLFVDGIHRDSTASYTFTNVTANHSINAHFGVLNRPPTAARLLDPVNNDTLKLDSSSQAIKFVWRMSADADGGDTLRYSLGISGPGVDTTITGLTDTSFSFTLPGFAKAGRGALARLQAGSAYFWTVQVTDGHVTVASPDTFSFQLQLVTGVADGKRVPTTYALYQNYPNPFNPTTRIQFDLPHQSHVTLKVYNLLGAEVSTLINDQQLAIGVYEAELNGINLASGIYFYRIVAEGENGNTFVSVRKLMLIK